MAEGDGESSKEKKKEPVVGTSRFTTDAPPDRVVVDDGATIGRPPASGAPPEIITVDDGATIGRPPANGAPPEIITIDDGANIGGPITSPGLPPIIDVPPPAIPERSGTDLMNDRLRADPDTNVRVRGVEIDPEASFEQMRLEVLLAVGEINIQRALAGKEPVEVDFEALEQELRDFDPAVGGLAITLGEDENGKPIGVSFNLKNDDEGNVPGVVPVSDEFADKLRANDVDDILTPLHEAGHLINGSDERGADGIFIARVAEILPDVEAAKEFLKLQADSRAMNGDMDHFVANDILLRMRHDLETDPAAFQARIDAIPLGSDGKPLITGLSDLVEERYVTPSQDQFFGPIGVEDALHYANKKLGVGLQDFIGTDEEERLIDPAPPRHIGMEGAVSILRMTMAVDEHALDYEGRDALKDALPELWENNREDFEEAQVYMREQYGIEVPTPPLPPAIRHEPTLAQDVNQRLRDDPNTNSRVRIVEFDRNDSLGEDDPEGKDALVMAIMQSVKEIGVARAVEGRTPPLEITQELIDKVTEAAENFDDTKSHATINLGTDANGKPIAITIINPRGEMANELDNNVVPISDAFRQRLERMDKDNLFNMLSETGREISGGSRRTRTHDAKVAAGMMLLDVAENGATPAMRSQLRTEADALSLSTDVTEFMQGDVLLRMKHDIKTNADGLRDAIDALPKGPDGRPLVSEVEKLALQRYVLPSDTDLPNLAKTRDALDFAENRLKGETPQKPIPSNITKDGAVALLRMQLSVEKHGDPGGPDNGLTAAMPELWRENPAAFEQAQQYMSEKYGITVQNPLLTPTVTPSQEMERGVKAAVETKFTTLDVKTADVKAADAKPAAKKPAAMTAGI